MLASPVTSSPTVVRTDAGGVPSAVPREGQPQQRPDR